MQLQLFRNNILTHRTTTSASYRNISQWRVKWLHWTLARDSPLDSTGARLIATCDHAAISKWFNPLPTMKSTLLGITYSEFDNTVGPKLLYMYPLDVMSKERFEEVGCDHSCIYYHGLSTNLMTLPLPDLMTALWLRDSGETSMQKDHRNQERRYTVHELFCCDR